MRPVTILNRSCFFSWSWMVILTKHNGRSLRGGRKTVGRAVQLAHATGGGGLLPWATSLHPVYLVDSFAGVCMLLYR